MNTQYKAWWTRAPRGSFRMNGRAVLTLLAFAAGLFAIGYGVAVYVLFPPPPVPEDGIVVPELAGQGIAGAHDRLRPLGLDVGDTLSLPHAKTARGLVVAQSPLPGQQLRTGGRVSLGLSSGLPAVAVPDVVGLAVRRAQNLLERLGFTVEQSTEPSNLPNGTVIRSLPEAGMRQPLPARVKITVSAGQPDSVRVDTIRRDTLSR